MKYLIKQVLCIPSLGPFAFLVFRAMICYMLPLIIYYTQSLSTFEPILDSVINVFLRKRHIYQIIHWNSSQGNFKHIPTQTM